MVDPNPPPISIGYEDYDPYVSGWYLLPVEVATVPYGISGLTSAQVDVLNAHTIQGLVELVYVRVGNDVLYQGLNGLDKALDVTTTTLQVLSAVQELHNALTTSSLGNFSAWFRFQNDYSESKHYESNYNSVASAFFGVPIIPDFVYSSFNDSIQVAGTDKPYIEFADQMANVRSQLEAQVQLLASLARGTPDFEDPNSLYNTSKQVLSDLPPVGNYSVGVSGDVTPIRWSDAKLWAMDFYGVYEGQDLAQVRPGQTVITFSAAPQVWSNVSLRAARQLGMGSGKFQGGGFTLAGIGSIRIVSPGQPYIPAGGAAAKTLLLTFSGRMAIAYSMDGNTARPTILRINPINRSGEVINPIQDANGDYIGSFNGVTRGQAQNAGLFEQNITIAISSAQGLNNTQTEQVRAFLFTFEEYYKSASSALSSMTQLIQKFAQGIRPA